MLYRRSVKFLTDGGEITQAIIPAVAVDTDLDQFVGGETGIDFFQDTVAQTILGDGNDRVQTVGTGAQFANLGGSQLRHVIKPF